MAGETGFGAGLFLGGVIGVLAGLLLAPKPGERDARAGSREDRGAETEGRGGYGRG